jgi:hypothetical protein
MLILEYSVLKGLIAILDGDQFVLNGGIFTWHVDTLLPVSAAACQPNTHDTLFIFRPTGSLSCMHKFILLKKSSPEHTFPVQVLRCEMEKKKEDMRRGGRKSCFIGSM